MFGHYAVDRPLCLLPLPYVPNDISFLLFSPSRTHYEARPGGLVACNLRRRRHDDCKELLGIPGYWRYVAAFSLCHGTV